MAAFTYASTLILLTEAFSLTYKSTQVPNFAIGTIMTTGAYVAYSIKKSINLPVYLGCPASFLVGALMMLLISTIIIEPLIRKDRSLVEITLATMGLGILIEALIQIYDEYIHNPSTNISLRQHDFRVGEVYGAFPVASCLAFSSYLVLRHVFKYTRFGCSIKASWDDVELAQIQGINPVKGRILLSILCGGFVGLAGGIMLMWFHVTTLSGSWIMVSIFASAFLGGVNNFRGAFIGGLAVGLGEILLIIWGQGVFGIWVGEFRYCLPLTILILIMRYAPNGLFGSEIKK
ncbi:branched-chain amino acid ABC transporter permease [Candidatus Bathyarchaeota archaeon]|nr:branched-chain amino acid ABC transporter permease [Candidatus Bathyarchaeota archaeon]